MCKYFDDCLFCLYDKDKCKCMNDGSLICSSFICCYGKDCKKDCNINDELKEITNE